MFPDIDASTKTAPVDTSGLCFRVDTSSQVRDYFEHSRRSEQKTLSQWTQQGLKSFWACKF